MKFGTKKIKFGSLWYLKITYVCIFACVTLLWGILILNVPNSLNFVPTKVLKDLCTIAGDNKNMAIGFPHIHN
jgi:hypothetical protein